VISGSTYLLAPLNLISGKTIRYARFTYSDLSPSENPSLYLYRVDRQGSGSWVWIHTPDAVGGTFIATSPRLDLLVDNANYAYYFVVRLGTSAVGADLKAMEIEISYVLDVYLSIPGASFVPACTLVHRPDPEGGGAITGGSGCRRMVAPVLLPDGALIYGMDLHFYDNASERLVAHLWRRNPHTGSSMSPFTIYTPW
jgi:hypothetical protein